MKLNLLPTYVGKGKQLTVAIVFGVMLMAACAGLTSVMISDAHQDLAEAKTKATQYDKSIDDAIAYSGKAEEIITPLTTVVRNINLGNAMLDHSHVYPDFYNKMRPYIPDFFRITNEQATPTDNQTVTFRVTGELKSQEQYRDLMLALLRIPGAKTVTRSGFTPKFAILPGVTEQDQSPVAPKPGEAALPKDQLERMNALIASGAEKAFTPAKGYGGDPGERGPTPEEQEITATILLQDPQYNLLTPDPSATLGVGSTTAAGGGGGGKKGGATGG